MIHFYFSQTKPHVAGDGRDKPVHLPVELDILHHIFAEGLQSAPVVMEFDSRDQGDQPVTEG